MKTLLYYKAFIVRKCMMTIFAKILKHVCLLMLLMTSNLSLSQNYNTTHKKAIKFFERARDEFMTDKDKALIDINKALSYDETFIDAHLLKAELCIELDKDSSAISAFEKVFEIDSMAFPKSAISLAKLYNEHYQFDKSINLLKWYLLLENQKDVLVKMADNELLKAEFRKSMFLNPVDYDPINIGNNINTSNDEYVNQFYVMDDRIVYTSHYEFDNQVNENIYVSAMMDSVWLLPQKLLEDIDSYGDVGAANISADGSEIYFSGCSWYDGLGSCDIYRLRFENGQWSKPENISSINTSEWESQPCLSYDGKELFFVRSNRRLGTSDIFVAKRDGAGEWSKAYRLDSIINTEGNEMAPFIHHDGISLYFSSDGHLGMGGYDLFVSRRDADGNWSEPVNLGYPLNTSGDEINIVISNDAEKAYISAVRDEGYGGYDIYEFEIDDRFKPQSIEIEIPTDDVLYAESLFRNESVVLKNIYFDFDSAELADTSEKGIAAILDLLNAYPDMKIELVGHTDDMGDDDYNMQLSKRRSDAVKAALVDKGIADDRIKTIGLGATKPIVKNDSDENRSLNRRVEMSIVNQED